MKYTFYTLVYTKFKFSFAVCLKIKFSININFLWRYLIFVSIVASSNQLISYDLKLDQT